jgi:hypothetical protein
MNRKKWSSPEIPLAVVALKLCEEAAEVGTVISDGMTSPGRIDVEHLLEELDHVDFISGVLRARVTPGSTPFPIT